MQVTSVNLAEKMGRDHAASVDRLLALMSSELSQNVKCRPDMAVGPVFVTQTNPTHQYFSVLLYYATLCYGQL